jgi:hypothetical protein
MSLAPPSSRPSVVSSRLETTRDNSLRVCASIQGKILRIGDLIGVFHPSMGEIIGEFSWTGDPRDLPEVIRSDGRFSMHVGVPFGTPAWNIR